MSNDVVNSLQSFVTAFTLIYTLLILAHILMSWFRLPYSVWLGRVRDFLGDTVEPYLRVFRRFIPPFGPLDLSPVIAIVVLQLAGNLANSLLDGLRP